ncbi:MAG TPA: FtsX-like permease family protein, partial [Planctomycetaceae bacterium]|nr:FtsX-like permease family protein [Planctomycetaceae bacterium]
MYRSLRYRWRVHVTVLIGVAIATTVLSGALFVGDSVRGSLADLTFDRLGKIDDLITGRPFFRSDRVERFKRSSWFRSRYDQVSAGIVIAPTTVATTAARPRRQVGRVLLLATDDAFWAMRRDGTARPRRLPGDEEIIINQTLADELEVDVGDEVTVRLPSLPSIPLENPFGKRDESVSSLANLSVVEVLPSEGFGRFELFPRQQSPRVAFVSLQSLQRALGRADRINTVFLSRSESPSGGVVARSSSDWMKAFEFDLSDFGLQLEAVRIPTGSAEGNDRDRPSSIEYLSLWSDALLVPPEVDRVVGSALGSEATPLLTYLANEIRPDSMSSSGRIVPYSLVTAIDFGTAFPLEDVSGHAIPKLRAGQMVINSWLADEAGLQIGDRATLTYYDPESPHGQLREREATFEVVAVTPLARPKQPFFPNRRLRFDGPFGLANDPFLAPPVKGFTDQASIDRWDVPFPIDYRRIKPADETYWKWYGTTPKAFVSREEGVRMWGSRFGNTTSWRLSKDADARARTRELMEQLSAEAVGLSLQPIKSRQLAASAGTTPFDMLFLGLSFFVIVAALLLVWLLYRLGIERRLSHIGLLVSVGIPRRIISRWLLRESVLVGFAGAVVGVIGGVAYLHGVIWALTTVWVEAIASPFLSPHVRWTSVMVGVVLGWGAALATTYVGVRSAARCSPLELLRESAANRAGRRNVRARVWRLLAALAMVVVAVGLAWGAAQQSGMEQAGMFVGSGFLLLGATWFVAWDRLTRM